MGIAGWIDYGRDMRREAEVAYAMQTALFPAYGQNVQFSGLEFLLVQRQSADAPKAAIRKTVAGEEYQIVFDGTPDALFSNRAFCAEGRLERPFLDASL